MHTTPRTWTLIFVALLGLGGCGNEDPELRPLVPGATVLAFGDSLTWGTGATPANSYPSVLAGMTGLSVINAGVPGEVTAEGLARLPALLDRHRPDLVILIHGGNDMLRRQPSARTAANLRAMIGVARAHGADIVMMAVPAPGLVLSAARFYDEVASSEDVPIDADAIADILQFPATKSDPVHPNASGYRELAQAVAALLRRHGALTD